jgi:two-component system sensor histidine kinase UhpB
MKDAGILVFLRTRLSRLTLFQRIAIGNSLIIILSVVFGTLVTRYLAQRTADWWPILLLASGCVFISLVFNFFIVMAALRPLSELGRLVKRLQSGEIPHQPEELNNPDPYTLRMAGTLQSLFLQLEERNRELRALSERALTAQEEERRGIAQGLHDDTGQALSMLIIQLDRIYERLPVENQELRKEVVQTRTLAANALSELRCILAGLHPAILDDLGLVPAIRWYARSHLEAAGLHVVVNAPGLPLELPPALTTTLFRIVQEAGNNILRHAEARSATIFLQVGADQIQLRVEDDGRGFHPQHASRDAVELQRLGLLGIRERAELFNGEVLIESAPE